MHNQPCSQPAIALDHLHRVEMLAILGSRFVECYAGEVKPLSRYIGPVIVYTCRIARSFPNQKRNEYRASASSTSLVEVRVEESTELSISCILFKARLFKARGELGAAFERPRTTTLLAHEKYSPPRSHIHVVRQTGNLPPCTGERGDPKRCPTQTPFSVLRKKS